MSFDLVISSGEPRHGRCVGVPTRCLQVILVLVAVILACVQSAVAEYRLDSGDVVEVSLLGKPELSRRAVVNPDGNIVLPLFGEIHVSGLTLGGLRSRITGMLLPDQIVRPSDIIVDLAEARPIMVAGEVVKPGPYPYRIGLTVAHAVALAGGVPRQTEMGMTGGADLASKVATLRSEFLRQQIRIATLTAELADRTSVELSDLKNQVPERQVSAIAELANRSLQARARDREQELRYLRRALDLADEQIASLEKGFREDSDSSQQQEAELQRVTELSRKGLSNPGRVSEEQRASSMLKSRQMDTEARLARARQDRAELARRLEKADDRQNRIPGELQEAFLAIDGVRAQLRSLAIPESLALQVNDGVPVYALEILRLTEGRSQWLAAAEDTPLEPGDLVKVSKQLKGASQ